jgi:L-aspartate oxidase
VAAPVEADFVIIGSGIAGLRAAIACAAAGRVVILTKSDPRAGSTGYAQGGIAGAIGPDDSPARHAADTIAAGDGLTDERAVNVLVEDGPQYVRELIDWGAAFDRAPDGSLDLAREGAHTVRRVLHAKDATGREIARALAARLAGLPGISVIDHALAVQLIVGGGRVTGVRFLDAEGHLSEVRATATLLATGGAGQIYRETTNPAVATGDGVSLAFLAGARVTGLEFVQFHPTALAAPDAPRYLLSEALRGEGAWLVNDAGERFMPRYDVSGDLAPRDRVARAIVLEAERTGAPVYLTMAHMAAEGVRARFPLITALCARAGLDLATDRLPVGPAAHYMMGGVGADVDGRTSLPGLFAAGEVACTGVHGANRLASNSLLEGLVFGGRAGLAMAAGSGRGWPDSSAPRWQDPPAIGPALEPGLAEAEVRELMWKRAGVFRDRHGLDAALEVLDPAWARIDAQLREGRSFTAATWRLTSLIIVARLVAVAARRREESRGAHARSDFPGRDDLHWKRWISDARLAD